MIKNDIINFSAGSSSPLGSMVKDHVYRGQVGKVLLGEAVAKNDLLYPVITSLGTIAEWKQSNANALSTMPAQALALEDGVDGQRIRVLFGGYIKDTDFDYGTRATGTVVISGTVIEGDRLVIGNKCFMMTLLTVKAPKQKAVATLSTTGVGVNAETVTIDGVVFECSTDGTIETTSDYMIDLQVSTAQGAFETAIEDALDQAIADKVLDISYVAFTGNDCVITLGGLDDSYVGLEQNDVVTTETCTNAAFGSGTFLLGVPAVDYLVTGDGPALTIAEIKVALTAAIVQAIADGLDITQAAWNANDLVLTAGADESKGYVGNNIVMYECDAAGTKDAGTQMTVSGVKFTGGVEGGLLYTAAAKGLLTLTKPSGNVIQPVGYAVEAEKFLFYPSINYENDIPQVLTGAGAVDLVSKVTHLVTTGADALTLADGVEGQRKTIILKTDGGAGTLTPTNLGNGATITFTDVATGSVELIFTDAAWWMIGGTATLA